MNGGLTIPLAHLAHSADRAVEFDLSFLLAACVALILLALMMWAPPMLAGVRSGAGLLVGSSRWPARSHAFVRLALRSPPSTWITPGLVGMTVVALAFVVYLTRYVPVQIPSLEGATAHRYWPAALAAAVAVAIFDAAVIARAIGLTKRTANTTPDLASPSAPLELRFQFVPTHVIRISAIASGSALAVSLALGLPLWGVALAAGLPWFPALSVESARKYEHYGLYAFFLVVVGLQLGHVGEHATQVTQLLLSNGDLTRSHGVFGQLDFETVHFFWDTGVWLSTGLLFSRFSGSRWLWVSFAAASLHEVEHLYLYWLFLFHQDFYMQGGLAGVLGRGGVVGSPLYRPYLHFLYNLAVAIPMLMALLERTWPTSTERAGRRR